MGSHMLETVTKLTLFSSTI